MKQLGYEQYVVQGGDWGSSISSWHAKLVPEQVLALHLTLVFAPYPKHKSNPMEDVTELEAQILAERKAHLTDGTGYQAIQGTKPQTLGYGLNDFPQRPRGLDHGKISKLDTPLRQSRGGRV